MDPVFRKKRAKIVRIVMTMKTARAEAMDQLTVPWISSTINCVKTGFLPPPKIEGATKSPKDIIKTNMLPTIRPGRLRGNMISMKDLNLPAPKSLAASNKERLIESMLEYSNIVIRTM